MLPFLTALTLIDMSRGDDLRAALHAHFARRRDDLGLLDQALLMFMTSQTRTPSRGAAGDSGAADRKAGAIRQLRVLDEAEDPDGLDERGVTGALAGHG